MKISTLLIPLYPGVVVKSKATSVFIPGCCGCNVSSSFAHMFPSSAISVGMFPLYSTLDDGVEHMNVPPPTLVALEQFAVIDEPFTDRIGAVRKNR